MGLLDNVVKAATDTAPAADGSQSSLASAVLPMLSSQSGGISGLIQKFTSNGFGNIVSSWVGTGQNLPISPEQVQSSLGEEQIKAIADKAGISPDAAKSGLAQILPQMIDRLTPNGQIPEGDLMSKGMELLKGKLF